MGDIVANISLGRGTEFVERVNADDPANSAIIFALLASTGLEADSVIKDKDDFSDLVSGTTNFATNTGAVRKTLTDAGGLTVTVDDTNDDVDVDMPDQTWTGVANDGTGGIGAAVSGYDPDTTGGTDADIVLWTKHDFVVTPNGGDITAQVPANGFFGAS